MQSQKQHQAHLLPRRSPYTFRLPVAARTHALMLSSATEITLTASTASATIADAILRQSLPLGEAVIAVAHFFRLAAEIACLGAGPAIVVPMVPLHTENLDRAIQRRNRLIKRAAWFSATASAAYIAAGAALASFSIIAGGALYLAAAWVGIQLQTRRVGDLPALRSTKRQGIYRLREDAAATQSGDTERRYHPSRSCRLLRGTIPSPSGLSRRADHGGTSDRGHLVERRHRPAENARREAA